MQGLGQTSKEELGSQQGMPGAQQLAAGRRRWRDKGHRWASVTWQKQEPHEPVQLEPLMP